jgi:hypothetical protein
VGRFPVESEPFAARQLGDLRGVPALLPGLTEDWRVAEEGTRVVARRCSCSRPLLETDADGFRLCVRCGREPSVRLPVSVSANGTGRAAAARSNGTARIVAPAWARPASSPVQLALF